MSSVSPPRPLTATTNQASLPGALSTVTFPLKKKILIWSFFCFQSGQGEEERCQQGPPPPRPQSVQGPHGNATQLVLSRGANSDLCRVRQRPPSSHDPEKKLVGKPGHTIVFSPTKGLPPGGARTGSERGVISRGRGFQLQAQGWGRSLVPAPQLLLGHFLGEIRLRRKVPACPMTKKGAEGPEVPPRDSLQPLTHGEQRVRGGGDPQRATGKGTIFSGVSSLKGKGFATCCRATWRVGIAGGTG